MTVLDAHNWPVLKCPPLAGFEVSPEARSQMRGTWALISVEEHTSMAPRPRRQSQNPPLQKSSAIPA